MMRDSVHSMENGISNATEIRCSQGRSQCICSTKKPTKDDEGDSLRTVFDRLLSLHTVGKSRKPGNEAKCLIFLLSFG